MTPEEKGIQLMTDMGTQVVISMGGKPSMPSDSSIKNTLTEVAKTVDDYTEKAAAAVQEMANALLDAVKEPIRKAISKDPKEMPKPGDISASIYKAIQDAAPTI